MSRLFPGRSNRKFIGDRSPSVVALLLSMGAVVFTLNVRAQADDSGSSVSSLKQMSLEQLAGLKVTSVSKTPESLSDAAAAVYVITHDDIIRSGATTIPEILRLAPNLQVAQMSASSYAITARGFNGNAADKLLVLIDGRSVYTPLFGGVLWDEQDVLPEDIERIEVISGPGATLWGANAVNGVINIITKKSRDSQGGIVDVGLGDREKRASAQYGSTVGDYLSYRVYTEDFEIRDGRTSAGADADDEWSKPQGGFRLDWTPPQNAVTLQGDLYGGYEEATPTLNTGISGGNLEATWQHQLGADSSFQLLTYFDETRRFAADVGYSLDTYDVEFQHAFSVWGRNDIVWGGGFRAYEDRFSSAGGTPEFVPESSTETLTDGFAQDTISLLASLKLTLGMKLEDDPYSGVAPLPNVRLSWKPYDNVLLWSAASRAVRAPTLFDEDLNDVVIPSVLILKGNSDFESEKLLAYEIGTRVQPTTSSSFSVSTYYNVYDDLRSVEWLNMNVAHLPLLWVWGNLMEGYTYGIEVWGNEQLTDWWRVSAGFNLQHEALRFKAGASSLNNLGEAGDDPNHQASLRSSIDIGRHVGWDVDLRYVGALPNPVVAGYTEFNTRIAWDISKSWQVALSGFNLLHAHHLEYEEAGATVGDEVYRSVYAEAKWRF